MSTLSELLPAGSGGKNVDFVASGTLASGQTVALKTDGTVEAVFEATEGLGAQTTFLAAVADNFTCVYDSTADRFVLIYRTNSDFYYYGVVGERSGSTLTFGTPQAVNTSNQNNEARAVYDPTANRVLVFQNNGNGCTVTPATVTANSNSISFATGQTFLSGVGCTPKAVCYDPVHLKTFLLWRNGSVSNYGYGSVFNASNPSAISIDSNVGTDVTGNNSMDTSRGADCAFDTQRNRIAIVYQSPLHAWLRISSLTISSGSPSVGNSLNIDNNYYWNECHLAFDSSINRFLVIARSTTNVGYGWVAEMDASGNMTATSALTTFPNNGTNNQGQFSSVSSNNAGKWVVVSRDTNTGAIGSYYTVTDYLLAPIFSNATNALTSGSGNVVASSIAFDGSRFLFMMQAQTTSLSVGRVFNFLSNNVSSFIGITDAAIADTATGSVTIKGGIGIAQATSQSNSLGSAELFNAGTTNYSKVVYDSNSNRIVVIYADNSNSNYGTAIVGTVSGSSVTYGTEQVFNTGTASYMDITFDSNSNRVVIAFTGTPANEYGTAIVGSVDPSNNSISFGTAVVYKNTGCAFNTCTFDSSNNKVVVAFRTYPSPQGIARVGTVDPSDNSITFGTEAVYNNGDSANQSSTFDSSNNKVVITFQDSTNNGRGTAIVGTVSGTGISFGSKVDFSGANNTNYGTPVTFDSNSNKIVVLYSGAGTTYLGRAKVGTISGTSISFGSEATFESGVVRYKAIAFDSTGNKVIIVYDLNQTDLKYVIGTVSGTDITFGTSTIFSTSNGVGDGSLDVAYDSSINRSVFAFRDESNSNQGTSQVLALAGILENLTPNSVYYVQGDGTISTTSTSPAVRIGKALSSTSINLEFNS